MSELISVNKLKIQVFAGLLCILEGFVMDIAGFYFLYMANIYMQPGVEDVDYEIVKIISVIGAVLLAEGVYFIIVGFIAAVTSGTDDTMDKCCKYGIILTVIGAANMAVILLISLYGVTDSALLVLMIPLVTGIFYYITAVINKRIIVSAKENNND